MQNRESFRYAGDLDLQIIEISSLVTKKKLDIYNLFTEVNIYENIFTNTISGTVTVSDSFDMIANVPFVGEEILHIVYKTPSMDDTDSLIEKTFRIYKISDKILNAEKAYMYIISFMSVEAFTDMFVKLGRAYKGQLSEIVRKLFIASDALGAEENTIEIEPSSNAFKFVAPNWSPLKCINWICPRAISKESNAPDYIFYEDMFKYNFKSISSLIAQDSYVTYYFNDIDPSAINDNKRILEMGISADCIVREFVNDKVFDIADRMLHGFYSSKLVEFDILSKKVNIKTFDYFDYFDKTTHLSKYPVNSKDFLRNPRTSTIYYPSQYYMHDEFGTDDPMSWVLERKSLMQQIEAHKIDITVPGRSDIFVGKTIDFQYNTIQFYESPEDAKESVYSGKYLISAINHRISRQEYEMVMTLTKDSISMELEG